MKYGVFVLNENPEGATKKRLDVLMDEAQSRGWEECESAEDVQALAKRMIDDGYAYIGQREVQSGPSGEGAPGGKWGYSLYFFKEGA